MKILITGAAGFVGSHSAELLSRRGHEVHALDNFSTGRSENLKNFRGKITPCDITDIRLLEKEFFDFAPDAVLHLAAQSAITTSISAPQHDMKVNGIGTLNVLKMANKYCVKRLVFSSTSAVYSEQRSLFPMSEGFSLSPASPYGISKMACEMYVQMMFPNHLIMRYGNVYGPRQKPIGDNLVIARAFDHFVNGEKFSVNGHGNQKRDFVYVGDVANCNMEALTSDVVGTFNVASGKSTSVNQVLKEIEKLYGVPGYRWDHTRENDARGNVGMNVSSIKRHLGWSAYTSISEGMEMTFKWWENKK